MTNDSRQLFTTLTNIALTVLLLVATKLFDVVTVEINNHKGKYLCLTFTSMACTQATTDRPMDLEYRPVG